MRRNPFRMARFAILLTLAAITIIEFIPRNGGSIAMARPRPTVRAPEFPRGMEWLNTGGRRLSLKELHGKVVLLDFWTYCCINCKHILPKLHRLEEKYGDALVVIGVHSAKFKDEGDTGNIRQAILRYEIEHPVVNDREFVIWKRYSARAWPTMVLIDPEGYIVGSQAGEDGPEFLEPQIVRLIEEYDVKGSLDRTPLALLLEKESEPPSLLSYPGKVQASPEGDRLFVSDSNHNRILVVSLPEGRLLEVIGGGMVGAGDGDFEEATFNHPQGTVLAGSVLYIADTENHLVRAADLENRIVRTVAGTGRQGNWGGTRGGPARETSLSSPWDLVFVRDRLYIAMAGTHQVWYYDPREEKTGVWAGSGREDIIDGPLPLAALAQPSGITTDGRFLYFADSEVSAIRGADLQENGLVSTIVGRGLFDFGDIDGTGPKVRLQHPLGVTWTGGLLYVADTYNNKIKVIDPVKRSSRTLSGNGKEGHVDGPLKKATFDEPGGISAGPDGRLYIADTNNHLVRVIDLAEERVSTLAIRDLDRLLSGAARETDKSTEAAELLPPATVSPGEGSVVLDILFSEEMKLNAAGGVRLELVAVEGGIAEDRESTVAGDRLPLRLPVSWRAGEGALLLDTRFVYCDKSNEGLCYFGQRRLRLPVRVRDEGGGRDVRASYTVGHP